MKRNTNVADSSNFRRQFAPTLPNRSLPQSPNKNLDNSDDNSSKNVKAASTLIGGTEQIQVQNVIKFIQKTMETLSVYEKQFRGQLNIDMTQKET